MFFRIALPGSRRILTDQIEFANVVILNKVKLTREAIAAAPIPVDAQQSVPISISIGLVDVLGLPLDVALNQADQAMYRAKVAGRNRIECAEAPSVTV